MSGSKTIGGQDVRGFDRAINALRHALSGKRVETGRRDADLALERVARLVDAEVDRAKCCAETEADAARLRARVAELEHTVEWCDGCRARLDGEPMLNWCAGCHRRQETRDRKAGAESMRERAASVWEAEAEEYRRLAWAHDLLPSLLKKADGARAIAARIRALPLDDGGSDA